MRRLSEGTLGLVAVIFFCTTLSLAAALVFGWLYVRRVALVPVPNPEPVGQIFKNEPVSPLLLNYQLDLPGRGELFPALAATNLKDYWPLAVLSISNNASQPVLQVVSAEIAGWTQPFEQTVVVGPHETRTLSINPTLLPRAYELNEIQHVSLEVRIQDLKSGTVNAPSRDVLIHSGSDLYWGKQFANAQIIARWVTPHDPLVLELVAHPRALAPKERLPGYNISKAKANNLKLQVVTQTRALFDALKHTGLSYVTSVFTFGGFTGSAERIRLPHETLALRSANCIDVSVAFASGSRKSGNESGNRHRSGHAFVGVRLDPQSSDTLYLDLTVLPKGIFQQAIQRAQSWLKKTPSAQVLTIDIASARRLGLYPLPSNPQSASAHSKASLKLQNRGPELQIHIGNDVSYRIGGNR